jgi:hypothetical protein
MRNGASAGEDESENGDEKPRIYPAARNPSSLKNSTKTTAQRLNTRKKIGGAGAGAENPSSGLVMKDYGPGRMHEGDRKMNCCG